MADQNGMSYTTHHKDHRRLAVAGDAARLGTRRGSGRIVYLDSELAEATLFFLAHGVPPELLEPVNRDRGVCRRVLAATGVHCTHGDIFDVLRSKRHASNHVVWLDLEQNSVRAEQLATALSRAAVVHVDLTCRAEKWGAVLDRAMDCAEEIGVRRSTMSGGKYPGKSGASSMVWMAVGRRM